MTYINTLKNIVVYFNIFIIYYVFFINSVYFLQFIFASFSLYDYIKKMTYSGYKKYTNSENMIPISILVPAYNEEETIVDNIKSLLALNYLNFEVVVVNDGSSDGTLKKIIEAFDLKPVYQPIRYLIKTKKINGIYRSLEIPKLIVVDKENGGKADSLNTGINISKYPIFASIDADSLLERDSLVRIIMPFLEDKFTIAVGGIVRIANSSIVDDGKIHDIRLPKNPLAMFQIIEYLRGFLTGRVGWDSIKSLLIISGAFGAFKKDAVIAVGGYATDTIGEDMELVVKLHSYMRKNKKKYKIKFIADPVCWTQAPERISELRKQRRRWQVGLMDSLFRHKSLFLNPKYKTVGMLAIPYFWIFEMLGPLVEFIGYILIPVSYFSGILNVRYFILFLMISILYGIILSIGAILLEEYTFDKYPSIRQLLRLSFYGIIENFGYRQMTTFFKLEGIIRFRTLKHSWGKFKRNNFHVS